MKNKFFAVIMLTAVVTACADKKQEANEGVGNEQAADSAEILHTDVAVPENDPADAAPAAADEEHKDITVKGEVTEINRGKDGYTAKVKGADGKTYHVTISIPNLEKQYREVKVGEAIEVTGEPVQIEEDILIRAKSLR